MAVYRILKECLSPFRQDCENYRNINLSPEKRKAIEKRMQNVIDDTINSYSEESIKAKYYPNIILKLAC